MDRLDLTTLEQLQPGFFYSQFKTTGGGISILGGTGVQLKRGVAGNADGSNAFASPSPDGPGDPMTVDRFRANFIAVLKLDPKKNKDVIREIEQVYSRGAPMRRIQFIVFLRGRLPLPAIPRTLTTISSPSNRCFLRLIHA